MSGLVGIGLRVWFGGISIENEGRVSDVRASDRAADREGDGATE